MHSIARIYRHVQFAVAFVLLLAASAFGQTSLSASPMRVEMTLAPGGQRTGTLAVGNTSEEVTRLRGEILDFFIDESSTPQFYREVVSESTYSCRKWLVVNPLDSELKPKGSMAPRYTIKVPKETPEGSYHCAVGYTTVPNNPEQKSAMGLVFAVRVVTVFYVTVGHPKPEPSVKSFKLLAPEGNRKDWWAVLAVENTGLLHCRPSGKAEVLDPDGKVVETVEFPGVPALPKRVQNFAVPLKTVLDAGTKYTVRAKVDIGLGEIQEARVVVEPQPQEKR